MELFYNAYSLIIRTMELQKLTYRLQAGEENGVSLPTATQWEPPSRNNRNKGLIKRKFFQLKVLLYIKALQVDLAQWADLVLWADLAHV